MHLARRCDRAEPEPGRPLAADVQITDGCSQRPAATREFFLLHLHAPEKCRKPSRNQLTLTMNLHSPRIVWMNCHTFE